MEAMREAWSDRRLDALDCKVDALGERMELRFDGVDERLGSIDKRLGSLESRFDAFQRTMFHGLVAIVVALMGVIGAVLASS
jgi:hypothetical protein